MHALLCASRFIGVCVKGGEQQKQQVEMSRKAQVIMRGTRVHFAQGICWYEDDGKGSRSS